MPICPSCLACLSRTSRLERYCPMQCPCAASWENRSKSSCGTSSTHAALHQRQRAPFPTQHSHLQEEQELIMQDPQSIQHRLSASRTPARTVDQLSACQKRRRVKYNLLYFYRRYGPTNAAAEQVCRPGLALERLRSAVSFCGHSGVPDDQAAGQQTTFSL